MKKNPNKQRQLRKWVQLNVNIELGFKKTKRKKLIIELANSTTRKM